MRFIAAGSRQAPGDLGVIRGPLGGATVAGDLDRARASLAYGMQAFRNTPRLYYMEAEIARASGDNGSAVYALQIARQLDNPQAGLVEPLPPLPRGGPAVVPGAPRNLPPNPFRPFQTPPSRPPGMPRAAPPAPPPAP